MVITQKILNLGLSRNGGYNSRQLQELNIITAFNKGWKKLLIGKDLPKENIDRFIALKDTHLRKPEPNLWDT